MARSDPTVGVVRGDPSPPLLKNNGNNKKKHPKGSAPAVGVGPPPIARMTTEAIPKADPTQETQRSFTTIFAAQERGT